MYESEDATPHPPEVVSANSFFVKGRVYKENEKKWKNLKDERKRTDSGKIEVKRVKIFTKTAKKAKVGP